MSTKKEEPVQASKEKDEAHAPHPVASAHPVTPASKSGKSPTTHTVVFSRTSVSPPRLEIAVGDTVHWHNADDQPHSVHFTTVAEGAAPPANSGDIRKDQCYDAQFSAAGTFEYGCDHNPHMRGAIVVS